MRFSTELVLAACIGAAMAGPTHRHLHRHVHAKKDLSDVDWKALDWDNMGINWSAAWAAGQHTSTTSTPTATPSASPTPTDSPIIAEAKITTTPAPPAPTTSSTSSPAPPAVKTSAPSIVSDVQTAFSHIVGMANDITEFGQASQSSGSDVGKIGNIGVPEGSNMMKVASAEGYDFTNTFINTASAAMTIIIWNKAAAGPSGVEANLGSCIALTNPALSFTLAPGQSQTVAFMDDTQIGFAQATSTKTPSGAPGTTWGECNFSSAGGGYDVSSILNPLGNTYDMAISSAEVSCVSDMNQNDWIANNGDANDPIPVGTSDGSCYVPGSTMNLTTKMGGSLA